MNWRNIKDIPKHKTRAILLLHVDRTGITCLSDVMENWQHALDFRKFQIENTYTHWAYLSVPKDFKLKEE